MFLKVNAPHVVHETIDGETILLDLRTGIYYSLDDNGSVLWNFLASAGDAGGAADILAATAIDREKAIREGVSIFVKQLLAENLLVEDGESRGDETGIPDNLAESLRSVAKSFNPPVIQKYSDMQDLLMLDPIHDVDQEGWPEPKDEE